MHALSTYEVEDGDQPGVFTEPSGAVCLRLANPFSSVHNPQIRVPPDHLEWLESLALQITQILVNKEFSA